MSSSPVTHLVQVIGNGAVFTFGCLFWWIITFHKWSHGKQGRRTVSNPICALWAPECTASHPFVVIYEVWAHFLACFIYAYSFGHRWRRQKEERKGNNCPIVNFPQITTYLNTSWVGIEPIRFLRNVLVGYSFPDFSFSRLAIRENEKMANQENCGDAPGRLTKTYTNLT